MSEKALIEENNRLREKLNLHNKNVYEDILVYIRMNYTSEDEETEEVLNDLLTHVIQAQQDGKDIESVTGSDYKSYADSIIQELPRRNMWKFASIIGMIFLGVSYFFSYMFDLIFNLIDGAPTTITINLIAEIVHIIITTVAGTGFVFLIFHILQYTLFKNWPVWKEYGLFFVISAGSFLIFMLFVFLTDLIDIGPTFEISMWILILLGIILMVSGFYLLFRRNNNA